MVPSRLILLWWHTGRQLLNCEIEQAGSDLSLAKRSALLQLCVQLFYLVSARSAHKEVRTTGPTVWFPASVAVGVNANMGVKCTGNAPQNECQCEWATGQPSMVLHTSQTFVCSPLLCNIDIGL